uniref:Putative nitroreductase TM1586 domain-containing protein n=1 Tax=Chromera velia CCMP2878 TaxID=1169474 RepID=A0A0G4HCX2_9ALVE|eukprot:Cvel_6327.t1-p1 / transcript=Cvel_6327.t1 / gene=Cvel_6327 / organism=Chromera_velia_CCMP2878 / gene_product=hypothetical protein / transcript_product=hypothetical protein / location=Cvel_scaffold307:36772-37800(-) / protein_length=343 / sequence_SO=supercontig / SO=protein_coding / is_pseudo=false
MIIPHAINSARSASTLNRIQINMWKLLDRVKRRYMFTGWLQFAPTVACGVLFLLVGFVLPGVLCLSLTLFDVLTVKWGWHPVPEPPPSKAAPRFPPSQFSAVDVIQARRSCRSFQCVPLLPEHRELLDKACEEAVSTWGGGVVQIHFVTAPNLRVWPVMGAHEFLVVLVPGGEYSRSAIIAAGAAVQHVVLSATREGISSCIIGPGADQRSVREAIQVREEEQHVVCVCAVGYASRYIPSFIRLASALMHRLRLPVNELVLPDSRTSLSSRVKDLIQVCRTAPSSYNAQPTRVALRKSTLGEDTEEVVLTTRPESTSRYYDPVALGAWVATWKWAGGGQVEVV